MADSLWSIYQKRGRWYMIARKLGGGLIALVPEGSKTATKDKATALRLAGEIATRLQQNRQNAERMGYNPALSLRTYGERYIAQRERSGEASAKWLRHARDYLLTALHYFEDIQPARKDLSRDDRKRMALPRNLASITAVDVADFQEWLFKQDNGRGGTYSTQTVRHHCSVLSKIYRRACKLGQLRENPVLNAGLPGVPPTETPLMEAEEVAVALEAARLVQTEAVAREDPRLTAQVMVHVALTLLAYTGSRLDEAKRVDWTDLAIRGDEVEVRIYGARKGANAKRLRPVRRVPLSSHAVPVLLEWRNRSGRIAGPILADPTTGKVPDFTKAFDAVERRANLPTGLLGSRALRVAYATHRAACTGIEWADVKSELGHASLEMQNKVYSRGRLNREPMGDELDFRFSRWAHLLGNRGAELARSTHTPDRWTMGRGEREQVIRAFLATIEGMGIKRAQRMTGVDRAAIQRLRSGSSRDVKGATLARMRAHLERAEATQAVA